MSERLKIGYHLPRNYFASVAPKIDSNLNPWVSPGTLLNSSNENITTSNVSNQNGNNLWTKTQAANFTSIPRSSIIDPNLMRQSLTPIDERGDGFKLSKSNSEMSRKEPFKPPEPFCNAKRVCCSTFSIILFLGAVAAVVTLSVLYFTQPAKESNYGESCLSKRCNQTRFLSCIDGVCQCNDFELEYYNPSTFECEVKSILERVHGQECLAGTTNCLNGTVCVASRCQCNSTTQYWNGSSCLSKKGYNQVCVNRNTTNTSPYYSTVNCVDSDECVECSPSSSLICNTTTNLCDCPSSMYYHDSILNRCIQLKSYYSSCTASSQCDSFIGLSCINTTTTAGNCPTASAVNRCDCSINYYYDTSLGKCNLRKGYYRPCTSDCECDSSKGLKCYNSYCTCQQYLWYDGTTCTSQKTYGQPCFNHIECRFDQGLTCYDNTTTCFCANTKRYYWSSSKQRCVECPAGWVLLAVGSTYRCYLFYYLRLRYSQASAICTDQGATLAVIESAAESTVLQAQAINGAEIYAWYWTSHCATSCPTQFNWINCNTGATTAINLVGTWYSNPSLSEYTPINDCSFVYLAIVPHEKWVYNLPERVDVTHRPLCEMP